MQRGFMRGLLLHPVSVENVQVSLCVSHVRCVRAD